MAGELKRERSFGTLAVMQIVSGGSAGFVEICLMHPLDLVKTRFQIQGGADDPSRYRSIGHCFRTMYQTEGLLSFYKGILPPIIVETPKRATKFFGFEQYKRILMFDSSVASPIVLTVSGLLTGFTEGLVANPFEVVKVRLQAERNNFSQQKSSIETAREIIRYNGLGLRGLNKGLTATLMRHGIFNMVYFGFYHNVKNFMPKPQNPNLDLPWRFGIGFCAGTLASCVNIPFDVAKSRIQGPQPIPGEVKYRHCVASIALIYKEEGFLALYKGLIPKIMRLGPGGAIMLIVFDAVYEKLQTIF